MSDLREENHNILEKLKQKKANVFTYPNNVYLDFAEYWKTPVNMQLVNIVNNVYFGRFDNDKDFIEAYKEDFGNWIKISDEEILSQYVKINNRYYNK